MKIRLLIIIVVSGMAFGQFSCAPKAAKSKTAVSYSEDLSGFRPPVSLEEETNVDETRQDEAVTGSYVTPEHDITNQLDIVLNELLEKNENKSMTIYTVQVYIGRSREEANRIKMKIFDEMPEVHPELVYRKLRFKVQVGKYYDRVSAYKMFKELKHNFPGAMLVPEIINVEDLTKGN
jgi:hypothetical protein